MVGTLRQARRHKNVEPTLVHTLSLWCSVSHWKETHNVMTKADNIEPLCTELLTRPAKSDTHARETQLHLARTMMAKPSLVLPSTGGWAGRSTHRDTQRHTETHRDTQRPHTNTQNTQTTTKTNCNPERAEALKRKKYRKTEIPTNPNNLNQHQHAQRHDIQKPSSTVSNT